METENTAAPGWLERFLKNPISAGVGWSAGIVGLILSIYFFLEGRRFPDLIYLINPTKTTVVRAGQTSRLSVTLDGKSVEQDVSAVQIAFWNEGKEPIRHSSVLHPLTIKIGEGAAIIDARIQRVTRPVVEARLNLAQMAKGEVSIDWKILERGDGGVVQLIFLGGSDTTVSATATLEGQPRIRKASLPTTADGKTHPVWSQVSAAAAVVGAATIFANLAVGAVRGMIKTPRRDRKVFKFAAGILIVLLGAVFVFLAVGVLYQVLASPTPPFEF